MSRGGRNDGQAVRVDEETWRALRLAVFSGMRVILETSVEHSAVISHELMMSVTVAYHNGMKHKPLFSKFSLCVAL